MPFGSGRWYRPVKEEAFRVSGSDPDARDKGGGGSGRQPRKVDSGLPISHPFKVELLHFFLGADEEATVVAHLDERDAKGTEFVLILTGEEGGLGLLHLPAVLLNGANWIVVYERSFG